MGGFSTLRALCCCGGKKDQKKKMKNEKKTKTLKNSRSYAESDSSAGLVAALISKDGSNQQDTAITYVNSLSDIELENATKKHKLSKEPVDISGSRGDQKLSRPDISNAENLKNGRGDSKEIESKELVVKSDTTKLVDDSVKSGNDKTNADGKNKHNQEKSMGIETDVEDKMDEVSYSTASGDTAQSLKSNSVCSDTKTRKLEMETPSEESGVENPFGQNGVNMKDETEVEGKMGEESYSTASGDNGVNTAESLESNSVCGDTKTRKLEMETPSEESGVENPFGQNGVNMKDETEVEGKMGEESYSTASGDKDVNTAQSLESHSVCSDTKTRKLEMDTPSEENGVENPFGQNGVNMKDETEIEGNTSKVSYSTASGDKGVNATQSLESNTVCSDTKTRKLEMDTLSEENGVENPFGQNGVNMKDETEVEGNTSEVSYSTASGDNGVNTAESLESNTVCSNTKTRKLEMDTPSEENGVENPFGQNGVNMKDETEVEGNTSEVSYSTASGDKGVNTAESLESNTVCSDTKTRKLEMDTPSEENGVENPIGQNGVNMKDETEVEGNTGEVSYSTASGGNGVNAAESLESNTVCSDTKSRKLEMETPSEESGVENPFRQNGVNMKDETEVEGKMGEESYSTASGDKGVNTAESLESNSVCSDTKTRKLEKDTPSEENGVENPFGQNGVNMKDETEVEGNTSEVSYSTASGDNGVNTAESLESNTVCSDTKTRKLEMDTPSEENGVENPFGQNGVNMKDETEVEGNTGEVSYSTASDDNGENAAESLESNTICSDTKTRKLEMATPSEENGVENPFGQNGVNMKDETEVEGNTSEVSYSTASGDNGVNTAESLESNTVCSDTKTRKLEMDTPSEENGVENPFGQNGVNMKDETEVEGNTSEVSYSTASGDNGVNTAESLESNTVCSDTKTRKLEMDTPSEENEVENPFGQNGVNMKDETEVEGNRSEVSYSTASGDKGVNTAETLESNTVCSDTKTRKLEMDTPSEENGVENPFGQNGVNMKDETEVEGNTGEVSYSTATGDNGVNTAESLESNTVCSDTKTRKLEMDTPSEENGVENPFGQNGVNMKDETEVEGNKSEVSYSTATGDNGVNTAESLESNTVCSDTKTRKLEMDTPSEENGVGNPFGQNGVKMKDETEVEGNTSEVSYSTASGDKGVNTAETLESNTVCSDTKTRKLEMDTPSEENGVEIPFGQNGVNMKDETEVEGNTSEVSYSTASGDNGVNTAESLVSNTVCSDTKTRKLVMDTPSEENGVENRFGQNGVKMKDETEVEGNTSEVSYSTASGDKGVNTAETLESNTVCSDTKTRKLEMDTPSEENGVENPFGQNGVNMKDETEVDGNTSEVSYSTASGDNSVNTAELLESNTVCSDTKTRKLEMDTPSEENGVENPFGQNGVNMKDKTEVEGNTGEVSYSTASDDNGVNAAESLESNTICSDTKTRKLEMATPSEENGVENPFGQNGVNMKDETEVEGNTSEVSYSTASGDNGVNASESLESNTVCIDTKTRKLEMDTPSEENGVENPFGQNGVNMKDETEVEGNTSEVSYSTASGDNGVNAAESLESNTVCSDTKTRKLEMDTPSEENGVENPFGQNGVNMKDETELEGNTGEVSYSTVSGDNGVNAAESLESNTVCSDTKTRKLEMATPSEENGVENPFGQNGVNMKDETELEGNTGEVSYSTVSGDNGVNAAESLESNTVCSDTKTRKLEMATLSEENGVENPFGQNGVNMNDETEVEGNTSEVSYSTASGDNGVNTAESLKSNTVCSDTKTRKLEMDTPSEENGVENPFGQNGVNMKDETEVEGNTSEVSYSTASGDNGVNTAESLESNTVCSDTKTRKLEMDTPSEENEVENPFGQNGVNMKDETEVEGNRSEVSYSTASGDKGVNTAETLESNTVCSDTKTRKLEMDTPSEENGVENPFGQNGVNMKDETEVEGNTGEVSYSTATGDNGVNTAESLESNTVCSDTKTRKLEMDTPSEENGVENPFGQNGVNMKDETEVEGNKSEVSYSTATGDNGVNTAESLESNTVCSDTKTRKLEMDTPSEENGVGNPFGQNGVKMKDETEVEGNTSEVSYSTASGDKGVNTAETLESNTVCSDTKTRKLEMDTPSEENGVEIPFGQNGVNMKDETEVEGNTSEVSYSTASGDNGVNTAESLVSNTVCSDTKTRKLVMDTPSEENGVENRFGQNGVKMKDETEVEGNTSEVSYSTASGDKGVNTAETLESNTVCSDTKTRKLEMDTPSEENGVENPFGQNGVNMKDETEVDGNTSEVSYSTASGDNSVNTAELLESNTVCSDTKTRKLEMDTPSEENGVENPFGQNGVNMKDKTEVEGNTGEVSYSTASDDNGVNAAESLESNTICSDTKTRKLEMATPSEENGVENPFGQNGVNMKDETEVEGNTSEVSYSTASGDNGVNASESLESNTVCIDTKTRKLEMDTPSEENGVENPFGQNGVNMKDETEVEGNTSEVSYSTASGDNGVNAAESLESNTVCSDTKTRKLEMDTPSEENGVENPFGQNGVNMKDETELEGNTGEVSYSTVSGDNGVNAAESLESNTVCSDTKTRKLEMATPSEENGVENPFGQNGVNMKDETELEGNTGEVSYSTVSGDNGVNAAESLESNTVCSDTKTRKLEMATLSEENGVENPFGQNGVNMNDETKNSSKNPSKKKRKRRKKNK